MSHDFESLKKWIGEKETAGDYVTIPSVERLSATLDRNDTMPKVGPAADRLAPASLPARRAPFAVGPDGHRRAATSGRRCRCRVACSLGQRKTFHAPEDRRRGAGANRRS